MRRDVPSAPQDGRRTKEHVSARGKAKARHQRISVDRQQAVMRRAAEQGLLGDLKDGRITGRVSRTLIEAAKRRTALSSDTDLITYALAKVALEDDFGEKLLALKGVVPETIDLEL